MGRQTKKYSTNRRRVSVNISKDILLPLILVDVNMRISDTLKAPIHYENF